jgi:aconitate hydratase
MSPEMGATCAIFPVDKETLRYLEFTGRPAERIELVEAYTRAQGLFHDENDEEATYSQTLELDLADVEPSMAGPKRPQDRVPLSKAAEMFRAALAEMDGKPIPKDRSPQATRPRPRPSGRRTAATSRLTRQRQSPSTTTRSRSRWAARSSRSRTAAS